MAKEPMTQDEFVAHSGNSCPACWEQSAEAGSLEADGDCAWALVKCTKCKAEWEEEYLLTGYSDLILWELDK